jgi:hypothetical protein
MYTFKSPSYYTHYWKPEDVTYEMLSTWKRETEEVNAFNKGQAADRTLAVIDLSAAAQRLFGPKCATLKAIKKNAVIGKTINFDFENIVMRPVKEYRDSKIAAEQKIKGEQSLNAYRERAIAWLYANTAFCLGVDFTILTAIDKANGIAFDKEVERLQKLGGYHSFAGQNCEGDCEGWDGSDRRCACGGRRVSWATGMGHSFENPYVYAEAY